MLSQRCDFMDETDVDFLAVSEFDAADRDGELRMHFGAESAMVGMLNDDEDSFMEYMDGDGSLEMVVVGDGRTKLSGPDELSGFSSGPGEGENCLDQQHQQLNAK